MELQADEERRQEMTVAQLLNVLTRQPDKEIEVLIRIDTEVLDSPSGCVFRIGYAARDSGCTDTAALILDCDQEFDE